jgi:hypothetical protein
MPFKVTFYDEEKNRLFSGNEYTCREVVAADYARLVRGCTNYEDAYFCVRVRSAMPTSEESTVERTRRFLLRRFNLSEDQVSISKPYTSRGYYADSYGLTIYSSVEKTTCGFSLIWWAIGCFLAEVSDEDTDERIIRSVALTFNYRSDMVMVRALNEKKIEVIHWIELKKEILRSNFLAACRLIDRGF